MDAETLGERGQGGVVMVVLAVLTAISLSLVFRPRPPSPFSEHGGFGVGYGSESIMFGASGHLGAIR